MIAGRWRAPRLTSQVRYPSKTAASGYAYATFETRKEALAFRDNSGQRKPGATAPSEIRTVAQGLQQRLDVCEKEGRDGRQPVTKGTLDHYEWRRDHILRYSWQKELQELTTPDVIEFRSWLLRTFSRDVAGKLLLSFHSMVLELLTRGILTHDIVAGVSIRGSSRHDEPVVIPTERDVRTILSTADKLANLAKQADTEELGTLPANAVSCRR